jgi:hypothetical protein
MKILFLLLITFNIYSQGLVKRYDNQYDLIRSIKKVGYEPNVNLTFNIRFIYLGKNLNKLTSDKIILIKNRLDNAFGVTKIRFTYDSKIYSYSTTMTIDSCFKYGVRLIDRGTYNSKDINFYIVENDGNIYNGFSTYPSSYINRIFIQIDYLNDGTMEHEMGHFFGLLHTFDRTTKLNEYNSEEEGDMIVDTKPDIKGLEFTSDCKLIGYDIDLRNYMSYYGRCRNRFTYEQIKLMNKIANYRKQFK